MLNQILNTRTTVLLALVSALGLSACTSIGYRCPLEPGESGSSPTACATMQDAMKGARKGTGGKTSVLMDDKGRLIPVELLENKPARALGTTSGEPYRAPSGEPVFHPPKVFRAWTRAGVDAKGHLHDGRTSWFSTPGRWAYGSVDRPGSVGSNVMRPGLPDARPAGRVIQKDQSRAPRRAKAARTPQANNKAALRNLSTAASAAAGKLTQPASAQNSRTLTSGVTAPAIGLAD